MRSGRAIAALALALIMIGATFAGGAGAEPISFFKPCAPKGEPAPFATYWAGPSIAGLRASAPSYDCGRPAAGDSLPIRRNRVIFIYGDCDASEGSCAPPLQIQTTPACDETFADIDFSESFNPRPEIVTARGVPAARFDVGTFRLYTGDVTIVIFGDTRRLVDRAVRAMRLAGASEAPTTGASAAKLPPPVPGHLNGRLYCGLPRPSVTAIGQRPRRARVAFDLEAAGTLSGEVWPAGEKIDPDLGFRENGVQFGLRGGPGRAAGIVRVDRPGRYVGEAVATAADGRHSRRVRFSFRVPR